MAGTRLELYGCATDPPERALNRWSKLLARVSLDDFDYPAQRLLPMVWLNLKRAGRDFPDEARLRGTYRRAWVQNSLLQKACLETIETLEAGGVPALVLKGQALNRLVYGDSGARTAIDFDLLVPFEQAREALDLLLATGWRPVLESLPTPNQRLENAVALRRGRIELDLHWFLLREARLRRSDAPFWEAAVPFTLGGRTVRTLCPTHHLLHLLVCASREPINEARYLIDLHYLVKRFPEQLDLVEVAGLLAERNLSSRTLKLPLEGLGLQALWPVSPSLRDRLWSECSREGEWRFALFPLLDYPLQYRGLRDPGWGLWEYLRARLQLRGVRDFLGRSYAKVRRLLGRV